MTELSDRLGHSRHNENFTFNQNYPSRSGIKTLNSMQEGNRFSAKTFGKSPFYGQNDWSSHCPAGQFRLLESALNFIMAILEIVFGRKNCLTEEVCLAVR